MENIQTITRMKENNLQILLNKLKAVRHAFAAEMRSRGKFTRLKELKLQMNDLNKEIETLSKESE